jgi:hypothetical protein
MSSLWRDRGLTVALERDSMKNAIFELVDDETWSIPLIAMSGTVRSQPRVRLRARDVAEQRAHRPGVHQLK